MGGPETDESSENEEPLADVALEDIEEALDVEDAAPRQKLEVDNKVKVIIGFLWFFAFKQHIDRLGTNTKHHSARSISPMDRNACHIISRAK